MPNSPAEPIAFIDLQAQRRRIASEIETAVHAVLEHGRYIMGPEVAELEKQLAAFAGTRDAVTSGSGTEALILPLMAAEIGAGDAVFVPSFTFAATAEVVALVGATPVFVDVDADTFNIDVDSLTAAIGVARDAGLRPRGLIPVDLFGLTADYDALDEIADAHDLFMLEDAAQSFGAEFGGRRACSFGAAGATSFFPAKPLGCYGDGGATLTDDEELAARMRSLRVHGQGTDKYQNVRIGLNARMDTLQAAIVLEKLKIFEDEIVARNRIADRYAAALGNHVRVPRVPAGSKSVWAQYTIIVEERDRLAAALKERGVPTAVYYPLPLHQQPAYKHYPSALPSLGVSESLSQQVLSLPMHPYLDETTQERIIDATLDALSAHV